MTTIIEKKQKASEWFEEIRSALCQEFENIESECGSNAKFTRTEWMREGGGGGIMAVMRGEIFEKVGVNVSTVYGMLDEKFAKEIPGTEHDHNFWASGISLVAHMKSPLIPAVHMNTRMVITSKLWFGGGADLTPTFEFTEDAEAFHSTLKETCDLYNPIVYPSFKQKCDEYFFLPHRNEKRGVGGIFYDYLNSGNWDKDFIFTQNVGKTLLNIFPKIVRKHYKKEWNAEQKKAQLHKRGRYVEFNLLYDRGTRFGLMTGGNTEAILMSLPPEAKWQ
jgi:coproporphyrinogen III oxidase